MATKWRVRGANRDTGREVEIIVEADSHDEAVKAAGATGMLISDVVPIAEPVAVVPPPQPPVPPPVAPTPLLPTLPVMLVRPPRRWGWMRITGLALIILGIPFTCVFGSGFVLIIVGAILMSQAD